jgi:hypothetical protein
MLTTGTILAVRFKEGLRFNNLRSQIVKGNLRGSCSSSTILHDKLTSKTPMLTRHCPSQIKEHLIYQVYGSGVSEASSHAHLV